MSTKMTIKNLIYAKCSDFFGLYSNLSPARLFGKAQKLACVLNI